MHPEWFAHAARTGHARISPTQRARQDRERDCDPSPPTTSAFAKTSWRFEGCLPSGQALGVTARSRCLSLAAAALASLIVGCGSPAHTVSTSTSNKGEDGAVPATATVRSAGLTVVLKSTSKEVKVGSTVRFDVTASDRSAPGAIGYRLSYGDGTSAENLVPMFCTAGKGVPVHETWRLTHRYKAVGRYHVSAGVYVNCTNVHVRSSVPITVVKR